jgi:hypothetical protein
MTPSQVRTAALQELRVLAAGEAIDPDDDALVRARYESLYATLLSEDLVTWGLSEDIPDGADIPVSWMLAYACAAPFGIELMRVQELQQKSTSAVGMLRRLKANKFVYTPIRTTYF